MDFTGPRVTEHFRDFPQRRPAHDGIIHQHHPLALNRGFYRVQLNPGPEIPNALRGLDKRPADIVVPGQTLFIRNPRNLRITQSRLVAGIGHGNHNVTRRGGFPSQLAAQLPADTLDRRIEHDRIRAGEINKLKDAHGLTRGFERAQGA